LNRYARQRIWFLVFWSVALVTLSILLLLILYILANGLSSLSFEFVSASPSRMGKEGGIYPIIIGTLMLVGLSLMLAAPIGIGAAVFLNEYVRQGAATSLIRYATETLAGIPSIVFGLFGFVFFVIKLKMGWSIISGAMTLALMVMPTIVRTAEEAMKAVPLSYREGSYALGANKWQTIRFVVLPSAIPGIAVGIILSFGRALGETAAVLLTAGSSLNMPQTLSDPARSLAVHLYILASEGISMERAFATASILVMTIFAINLLANFLMRRMSSRFSQF